MKLNIRPIEKSDNPLLSKIIKDIFIEFEAPKMGTVFSDPTTNDLFKVFEKDRSICWIGEIEGKVMGCCGIYPTSGLDENCCELVKFYLHKEARGQGLGRALLKQCEASAINLGYEEIYIESLPEFEKAVGMYEEAGYRWLDKAIGDSGHFGCTVYMIKDLV